MHMPPFDCPNCGHTLLIDRYTYSSNLFDGHEVRVLDRTDIAISKNTLGLRYAPRSELFEEIDRLSKEVKRLERHCQDLRGKPTWWR